MKLMLQRAALILSLAGMAGLAQQADEPPLAIPSGQSDVRLPNGKMQRDEILKAEHEQNVKDAARLVELTQDLKESIEKDDRYVLSISTLKKTDEIEKLVKKIRSRLRHD
jgi:hypothetical protein